jgi:hypothetical protein
MSRASLGGVLVLERVAGSPAPESFAVERLDAGAALVAVLAHAYCFELEDAERKRRMMDQFLALVARVPVHRLRYRSGLDRLPALVAGLDSFLAGLAARPA